ncbi:unnamed protein product [Lathyrus sativus]|nr:unnamed protein product [Lathyrus sativus]
MDRKRKNPNQFFSYVRFEASGDSEADSDPNMDCEKAKSSLHDEDNDDALSCSGGSTVDEHDDGDENEKRKDEEEEKDVVYGKSYCEEDEEDDEVHGEDVDLGGDLVDENEKNRRFWEACMAS